MKRQDVAIVTGASRGIGQAIALRLARDGYAVVVNYAGNEQDAKQTVAEITKADGRAIAVKANVTRSQEVKALFDAAEAAFGPVTVLINNAGVMQPGLVSIVDTDDALFERIISTNLQGVFNTLREAGRRMKAGSRIINLSTSVLGLASPGYGAYAASKAGVEAMTKVFANELRGREIRVNAVAPGPTKTDLFLEGKPQELVERISKLAPLERLGTVEDTTRVVAFLVGEEGAWVNGQVLRVNGGMV
ncbi:SDR family oxidoreductase [Archangium violaceum]|uniref:SDR family oxidoreductase n=1 Tax=Archangium violaceum TaxID=83451 RepID=UPI002B2BF106|nr:SDR family oxidoreductase [Archangium gephyra]